MIHTLRISKPAREDEYVRLMEIKERWRPRNLEFKDGTLSMDYTDGRPPVDIMPVWEAANEAMWLGEVDTHIDVEEYMHHLAVVLNDDSRSGKVLAFIRANLVDLTPVRFCHGDLTLYNVIQSQHDLIFIDPCGCHGLPCREMDESKMMQSLDGFGLIFRGLPQPNMMPRFTFKPAHFALLCSHYVRMLPHVSWHEAAFRFANRRIEELTCTRTS